MQGKTLHNIPQEKTVGESHSIGAAFGTLDSTKDVADQILRSLHPARRKREWEQFEGVLGKHHKEIYNQFVKDENDGFERVGKHAVDSWCPSGSVPRARPRPEIIERILARAVIDVQQLDTKDRLQLLRHLLGEMEDEEMPSLLHAVHETDKQRKVLKELHAGLSQRTLADADVVGLITSGLAKNIQILRKINCRVMICEEAGEICKPHTLSGLLPSFQHFIAIGDHEQLKPQINNYDLSIESRDGQPYQLDRSQFERLATGECGQPAVPIAQLSVQRRMRPQISKLIRATIYPRLVDHDVTKSLPDVVRIRDNVFWLDREHLESGSDIHRTSYSNTWEADIAFALVRHVVRQGKYKPEETAVLVPYLGQIRLMRQKFED